MINAAGLIFWTETASHYQTHFPIFGTSFLTTLRNPDHPAAVDSVVVKPVSERREELSV